MSAPSWPLHRRTGRALGGALALTLARTPGHTAAAAEAALDAAVVWLDAFEARCSRFRATSELTALNRSAGAWFRTSTDLFAIVAAALDFAQATDGLFDPTLLPTIRALGYDQSFERIAHRDLPAAGAPPPAPPLGSFRRVLLDPARLAIWLPPGLGIDLGGIGKGWAADRLLAGPLAAWPDALVELGGDLAVRGGPGPGTGWIIGARDPRRDDAAEPAYLGGVTLRRGGVATSGAAWRWWRRAGFTAHHLVDPRTGQPATAVAVTPAGRHPLAATALAETGAAAEVAATVAVILGVPAGLARLSATPAVAGWFILSDGSLLPSVQLATWLAAHGP